MSDVVVIELQEDDRRPEIERIRLEPGETFRLVYSPMEPPLRRFLLRGGDRRLGEPGEMPFLWLRAPDSARPWLRVTQVDPDVVEQPRVRTADKLLVAIEQDRKLSGRTTVVVKPPGERAFDLELRVAGRRLLSFATLAENSGAAGDDEGAGDEAPDLDTEAPELDWQVPGVWESYGKPLVNRYQSLRERIFQKLRPPPGLGRGLVLTGTLLALVGYSFYSGSQARGAKAEAAESRTDQENADAAAVASAEDAGTCRTELAELQRGMLTPEAARRSLVLAALDYTRARSAFLAGISQTAERDEAMAVSEQQRPELVAAVTAAVVDRQLSDEERLWAEGRLDLERSLEGDLPQHALLWHPRPDDLTDEATWGRGGTSLRGPFALGERPLRMLGGFEGSVEEGEAILSDPRPQTEWSIGVFSKSLDVARSSLLAWSESASGGRGLRMAVPPEELHLWSLALFSAWNELPMGETAGGLAECTRLVLDTVAARRSAEPGDAVLPSVLEVVSADDWLLPVGRTAACPWRDEDLFAGVRTALGSVSLEVVFHELPE